MGVVDRDRIGEIGFSPSYVAIPCIYRRTTVRGNRTDSFLRKEIAATPTPSLPICDTCFLFCDVAVFDLVSPCPRRHYNFLLKLACINLSTEKLYTRSRDLECIAKEVMYSVDLFFPNRRTNTGFC
jgi:hypothetical protein